MYFRNHGHWKMWLHNCQKKFCFGGLFDKQERKRAEKLLKSEQQRLHHICWSLWTQSSRKKSLLVICKILRLFVNTFTSGDKYSLLNKDNLLQSIDRQLYQKQKSFSGIIFVVLNSRLNFEHFQKEYDTHSWCISEITNTEKCGYIIV